MGVKKFIEKLKEFKRQEQEVVVNESSTFYGIEKEILVDLFGQNKTSSYGLKTARVATQPDYELFLQ